MNHHHRLSKGSPKELEPNFVKETGFFDDILKADKSLRLIAQTDETLKMWEDLQE